MKPLSIASRRRYSIIVIVAVLFAILLAAAASFRIWLGSIESWASIGSLQGYDVRPDRHAIEMNLRNDFQEWLEERGFHHSSLPESLVESRGDDWKSSVDSPVVYSGSIDGDRVLVVIWTGNKSGVEYWKARMYYRTVPEDLEWLPGAAAGHDSAQRAFDDTDAFLNKARKARLGSSG